MKFSYFPVNCDDEIQCYSIKMFMLNLNKSTYLNNIISFFLDWSDSALKLIEVSRLDGNYRKTLIRDNLDDVRSIILYKKFLFFADWGSTARIERCLLDGSERKVIIGNELGFPTGLAVDFEIKKLYWADALHDRVEMSDFNGKQRSKIIMHAEHPFGFTLTNNYFYFTDW